MSEDLIIGVLLVIFVGGIGSFLFKLYVLDKIKCRKLFDNLKLQGFCQLDLKEQDIVHQLNDYKLAKGEKHLIDTFKYIVVREKESAHKIYLCDVYRKTGHHQRSRHHQYYNIFIETLSLPLDFEIIIRPKLSPMIESMMQMRFSKSSSDVTSITEGLEDDFKLRFAVDSKSESKVCLSKKLQDTLLQSRDSFPFNKVSGAITPIVHISPEGFAIISNRVTQKRDLDSLLYLGGTLTDILLKSSF